MPQHNFSRLLRHLEKKEMKSKKKGIYKRTVELNLNLTTTSPNNIQSILHIKRHEFYCCVMYSGVEYVVCCYSECISHTRQAEKSA